MQPRVAEETSFKNIGNRYCFQTFDMYCKFYEFVLNHKTHNPEKLKQTTEFLEEKKQVTIIVKMLTNYLNC